MKISFALDGDAAMVGDAVRKFCATRFGGHANEWSKIAFTRELWSDIADLGVFMLGSDPASGGYQTLAAAFEEFGRVGCPGPLATTSMAAALSPTHADAILTGRVLVSVGKAPLMPWGAVADLFMDIRDGAAWLVDAREVAPVATLGDTACARIREGERIGLGSIASLLPRHDVALGCYLAAAALTLIETSADYARDRRQFGRPVGDFQAVAMPLAEAAAQAEAARTLARAAALHLDQGVVGAEQLAALARVSAGRAARRAAFVAHQSHGAIGVTRDGPVFWLSRKIQELCLQAPDDAGARERFTATLSGSLGLLIDSSDEARAARCN